MKLVTIHVGSLSKDQIRQTVARFVHAGHSSFPAVTCSASPKADALIVRWDMNADIDWESREPERFRRAHELLMMEQSKDHVLLQLISTSFSEADATALVDQAWERGREARHKEGIRDMNLGLIMFFGGIAGNLVLNSWLASSGSPLAILVWGIPLYGAGHFYWGWKKRAS